MRKLYLIWSQEHGAWWMPNSNGYTRDILKAGRYRLKEAYEIIEQANSGEALNEVLLPWEVTISISKKPRLNV